MTQEQAVVKEALDREWVEVFARSWLEAWSSHDPERVLAHMTEDVVYDDSAWPTTMHGHADVRAFLEHTWRAFPDLRFEVVDGPFIHPDEPKASFYWRGHATHSGPIDPPGLAPTGRQIEFEGADVHEYRDGKLSRLRIVFDLAETMRQLGTLPEPGSAGERMAMRMANLQTRVRRRS